MGTKINLDPAIKAAIEAKLGITLDGEVSIEDAKKVYDLLHGIVKQLYPSIDDKIDDGIDIVEAYAMKRKPIPKHAILTLCKGIRTIAGVPDDDDNVTQK